MRRRDCDANPSEASRTDTDEYSACGTTLHQFGNHRYHALGVPAANHFIRLSETSAIAVEQGGGASCAGRVERQDHGRDCAHSRLNAASPRKLDGFKLDRLDAFHFGYVMADQAFDPALERHG